MHTKQGTLVAIVAVALGAGCQTNRAEDAPLVVAVGPRPTMAPMYLAVERGFFRDEHLTISLKEVATPLEAITLVGGGAIDIGLFSFVPALPNAISRGAPMRIVAGRDSSKPGCTEQSAFYYRRERFPRGVSERQDWIGARVALSSPNAASEFYLDTLLDFLKIGSKEVQRIRMSNEEAFAAAAAGTVDIFFATGRPAYLDAGLPPQIGRSDLIDRVLGELQYAYIVFGTRVLNGDETTGVSFLRAYLRAVRAFVDGDTPQFLDDIARRMRLNPVEVRNACRDNLALDGIVRLRDLEIWLTWAKRKGYVAEDVTADQLVDERFQRGAMAAGSTR